MEAEIALEYGLNLWRCKYVWRMDVSSRHGEQEFKPELPDNLDLLSHFQSKTNNQNSVGPRFQYPVLNLITHSNQEVVFHTWQYRVS